MSWAKEFLELDQHHTRLNISKREHGTDCASTSHLASSPPSPPLSPDAGTVGSIPPPTTQPSAFAQSALLIRRSIADVHSLLHSQLRDYLTPHRHLSSARFAMRDADGDALELTAQAAAIVQQLNEPNVVRSAAGCVQFGDRRWWG